jgi:hypothetical protein
MVRRRLEKAARSHQKPDRRCATVRPAQAFRPKALLTLTKFQSYTDARARHWRVSTPFRRASGRDHANAAAYLIPCQGSCFVTRLEQSDNDLFRQWSAWKIANECQTTPQAANQCQHQDDMSVT